MITKHRSRLLLFVGSMMSILFIYQTNSNLNLYVIYRNYAVNAVLDKASLAPKTILYWHPPGELRRTKNLTLPKECGSCRVTAEKKLINDNQTTAVIFLYEYIKGQFMNEIKNRNPEQIWIWFTKEAPPYLKKTKRGEIKLADYFGFNLTMTTRKDSDIVLHYDKVNAFIGNLSDNFNDILKKKKYLALTAVSNCGITHGAKIRLKYLKKLIANGFELDAKGKCFNKHISRTSDRLYNITSQYKFYFAFENAYHCKGYVTEKLFRGLRTGSVPVVWGGTKEEYESQAPPGSFIFVDDFSSMSALTEYLNYLDKNDEAYLKYFKWRKTRNYKLLPKYRGEHDELCQICRKIHGINDVYSNNYNDVISTINEDGEFRQTIRSVKEYLDSDNEDCMKNLTLDEQGRIKVVEKV